MTQLRRNRHLARARELEVRARLANDRRSVRRSGRVWMGHGDYVPAQWSYRRWI